MVTLTDAPPREEISLLASLTGGWLKLPLSIVRDVGPAAQTLGGILKISNRETFVSASKVAERVRLPLATVRKHLVMLHEQGWIDNAGREHTRAGRARRTCTLKITTKTKAALGEYGILPWWACSACRLPWSAKALLSFIMANLAKFKKAAEGEDDLEDDLEADDDWFWLHLETLGGEDRFRFSLDRLTRETGLSRPAIVKAKQRLAKLGIIEWNRYRRDDGGDILFPNPAFRVVVTPQSEGMVTLTFKVVGG